MMTEGSFDPEGWRADMISDIRSSDIGLATDALLGLTYNEPDRTWLEGVLLECVGPGNDEQIRALSVTCMGHVARLHRAISPKLIEKLKELLGDPVLGGRAEDALDDVESFVAN
ncbi:hypothetical protein [Crossiella sp. CA198]|uniref:hypothetical protein n=1 Tax=Crossiella sp. CA198 TaxID=3455607 RepID=UPI003F8D28CD